MISYLDDTMSVSYDLTEKMLPTSSFKESMHMKSIPCYLTKQSLYKLPQFMLYVNVLIGVELLKPSRTHVCKYLLHL